MLPPKLAQIIINLAAGDKSQTILDPFCGTGVILQEAALMGYAVYGTDNDARMIDYTQKHLDWLQPRFNVTPKYSAEVGDATRFKWKQAIDAVATEVFLGKPMSGKPEPKIIREEIAEVQQLLKNALRNLASQLKPGTKCCFAIPAWFYDGNVHLLPLIDQIEKIGYTLTTFRHVRPGPLIYRREGQIVGRQLLTVTKS